MRLTLVLVAACALALVPAAWAGDYHTGAGLICSDCHVAHFSQTHAYTSGGTFVPLGAAGPYVALLRNDPNDLCLACHDNNSIAPDVFGDNVGKYQGTVRRAGALNALSGKRTNDTGYDEIDGHTLWSPSDPPGHTGSLYVPPTDGLECVSCHSQHGSASQYRNLRTSTSATNTFYQAPLTYVPGGANIATRDVFERNVRAYADADVDYNEPDPTKSAYAKWCSSCHKVFHGTSGGSEVGGGSGGDNATNPEWTRHPQADVNIGQNASFISSLNQFNTGTSNGTGTRANRVKVMDSQGLWNGTAADNTVTPSCFSCHKSHGNKNGFGLIFMAGNGTVTEEGDGGQYKDLCRQCHIQGG